MLAGLKAYVKFLHNPRKDEPALVFDMIEEFCRQAVDRAVITMVIRSERLAQAKDAIGRSHPTPAPRPGKMPGKVEDLQAVCGKGNKSLNRRRRNHLLISGRA